MKDKAFFVHIPKTAGNSIRQAFRPHNLLTNPGFEKSQREHHFGSKNSKRVKGSHLSFKTDTWPCYLDDPGFHNADFSFTAVRNPYDLLFSYYSHYIDNSLKKNWIDKGWANVNGYHKIQNFEQFVDVYTSIDPEEWHVPDLCRNLFGQIFSEEKKLLVDKAIFVESLDDGLSGLASLLNYETKISASRLNTSPGRKKDHTSAYDESMVKKVRKKCEWELDTFKYTFDTNNSGHKKTVIDLRDHV